MKLACAIAFVTLYTIGILGLSRAKNHGLASDYNEDAFIEAGRKSRESSDNDPSGKKKHFIDL